MRTIHKLLFALRTQLILWLAGDCSVLVNVDFWGKVLIKGRWLANHNCIALDPDYPARGTTLQSDDVQI